MATGRRRCCRRRQWNARRRRRNESGGIFQEYEPSISKVIFETATFETQKKPIEESFAIGQVLRSNLTDASNRKSIRKGSQSPSEASTKLPHKTVINQLISKRKKIEAKVHLRPRAHKKNTATTLLSLGNAPIKLLFINTDELLFSYRLITSIKASNPIEFDQEPNQHRFSG